MIQLWIVFSAFLPCTLFRRRTAAILLKDKAIRSNIVGIALTRVMNFTSELAQLRSEDEVWLRFAAFVHGFGFKHAVYWDIPGPGETLEDNILFGAFHPVWRAHYSRNNYLPHDPCCLHMQRTALPYSVDDVLACPDYTPEQRRIRAEAREFGVKAGFFIPLRSPRNGPSLISLGGEIPIDLSPGDRAEIHLAAISVDARLRPMAQQHEARLPPLTLRERECLQWVAVGKSDHDIGEILRISEKTVNFHIEHVKRKYAVSSRTLAASMAVRGGVVRI
jgi:LuxR family quorum sensing-dependent transcriptional regulator